MSLVRALCIQPVLWPCPQDVLHHPLPRRHSGVTPSGVMMILHPRAIDGWMDMVHARPKRREAASRRRDGACIRFSTLHECAYNAFSLHVVQYHSSSALRRRIVEEGQRLLISLCPTDVMHRLEWNGRKRRFFSHVAAAALRGVFSH